MSVPGDLKSMADSNIPCLVQALTIVGDDVPQSTSMKAYSIDVEDLHEDHGGDMVELLGQ